MSVSVSLAVDVCTKKSIPTQIYLIRGGRGKKRSNFDLLKFSIQVFEPEWLYTGDNFGKVLNTLLAVNFATQGKNLPSF